MYQLRLFLVLMMFGSSLSELRRKRQVQNCVGSQCKQDNIQVCCKINTSSFICLVNIYLGWKSCLWLRLRCWWRVWNLWSSFRWLQWLWTFRRFWLWVKWRVWRRVWSPTWSWRIPTTTAVSSELCRISVPTEQYQWSQPWQWSFLWKEEKEEGSSSCE